MKPTKEQICTLLDAWISQRPGLDFRNYGDVRAYRAEVRSIGRDLQDARQLLRAVELSGITAEQLAEAFPRAYSGRLSLIEHKGRPALDYCTGQYWPTEYRRAACAVLASALWDYKRDYCMPAPQILENGDKRYNGKSAGDWLRSSFWREFGRTIAARWFN